MLNVGIIGAGGVARAHARGLATLKSAELVGVHDVDPSASEALTRTYGGVSVGDVDGLLEITDAVIVAAPNFTHSEYALAALSGGRSVLCEKPLALSQAEATKMVKAAHEETVPALVGFNYRHLPVVRELHTRLRRGDLGIPCSIELAFRKNSALRRNTHTWRDSSRSRGTSGALGDLGVHLIDLLTFTAGGHILVDDCRARVTTHVTAKDDEPVEVDDHSEVYGRLSTGTFFTLVTSKAAPDNECGFAIRVVGTEAVFNYHSASSGQVRLERGADTDVVDLGRTLLSDPPSEFHGWSDSFRSEIDEWARISATPPRESAVPSLATFEDGLAAQEVLDALLHSTGDAEGLPRYEMIRP